MEKRDKKYRAFLIFFAKSRTKKIFFLHIVCILYMYTLKKFSRRILVTSVMS